MKLTRIYCGTEPTYEQMASTSPEIILQQAATVMDNGECKSSDIFALFVRVYVCPFEVGIFKNVTVQEVIKLADATVKIRNSKTLILSEDVTKIFNTCFSEDSLNRNVDVLTHYEYIDSDEEK